MKPAAMERGVTECSAHTARMKMKLPLQQQNETVNKLAVTGKDISVWNDKTKSQSSI